MEQETWSVDAKIENKKTIHVHASHSIFTCLFTAESPYNYILHTHSIATYYQKLSSMLYNFSTRHPPWVGSWTITWAREDGYAQAWKVIPAKLRAWKYSMY